MKFDDYRISSAIKSNLHRLTWKRPTDIQFKCIPAILDGEDVLAIAQTGTGKTAAFAIPVIHKIIAWKKPKEQYIRCLVMVPTRELGIQITDVFKSIAEGTDAKIYCLTGGVDQYPQIAYLNGGVDILVATPGRMFDLVSQGHLHLEGVRILVLDEADRMLALGFHKDITDVQKKLPPHHQTLFFSATINPEIKKLAYKLVRNAIRIQISPKDPVAKNIEHSVAFIEMDDKRHFLERLINEHPDGKILVFVRTKVRAERVLKAMERVNIKAESIHGDKDQAERNATMQRFRNNELKLLIATDVSARGIDIPDVELVVNYDLPEVPENYVHRVGRTGRGTKKGIAISFCANEEKDVLEEIESFLENPISIINIKKAEYEETIMFSGERQYDIDSLLAEVDEVANIRKKKKKK